MSATNYHLRKSKFLCVFVCVRFVDKTNISQFYINFTWAVIFLESNRTHKKKVFNTKHYTNEMRENEREKKTEKKLKKIMKHYTQPKYEMKRKKKLTN